MRASSCKAKGWSRTVSPLQGSLHATLGCFPDHWQVVLSFACSVASLSLSPSRYLPGRPRLRRGVLADYLFGKGSPSTWCAGRTTVHGAPSATLPFGAQRGITLSRCPLTAHRLDQECKQNAHARAQRLAVGESFVWRDASKLHLARIELATFSVLRIRHSH